MVANCVHELFMAQVAVDSTRNEFKLGKRRIFNDFCGKTFRIHAFKVTNTTNLISLETGDEMLCITYIHNSIL